MDAVVSNLNFNLPDVDPAANDENNANNDENDENVENAAIVALKVIPDGFKFCFQCHKLQHNDNFFRDEYTVYKTCAHCRNIRDRRMRKLNLARRHTLEEFRCEPVEVFVTGTNGRWNARCSHCGAQTLIEEKLCRSSKRNPKFGRLCCKNGVVQIPLIEPPFPLLRDLLSRRNDYFKKNIRKYNNCLAFASICINERSVPGGCPNFSIQGRACHKVSNLIAPDDKTPAFVQTYAFDSSEQAGMRAEFHEDLKQGEPREILESLLSAFMVHNPHAQMFHQNINLLLNDEQYKNYDLVIRADPKSDDLRRYNMPSDKNEVAVLLPMEGLEGHEAGGRRDITLHAREGSNQLITMHETHQCYDPWCYPLIHPFGDAGWTLLIPHVGKTTNVSAREFYAFRLHSRGNDSDFIFLSGRLFQEYVTDMWAKVEHNNLRYIVDNQSKLRASIYQGAMDHLVDSDADDTKIGKRIILPSTFSGSPRAMMQQYYDSMAIAGKFGKPVFFITLTMNPKRPEVLENIPEGQDHYNRPDLTARGFKVMLDDVMTEIVDKGIFGHVCACTYVIEFQKRGLPHAHLLVWVEKEDVPKYPAQLDRVVSAEIPNSETQGPLFDRVVKHMTHGPCGPANRNAPCMREGYCSKGFPKLFQSATQIGDGSFPSYRRRSPAEGGETVETAKRKIDNSWIVPYSPYLLMRYNSHINVEVCSGMHIFKYLHLYMNKGPDKMMVSVRLISKAEEENGQVNEVTQYQDVRYIGSSEACWRMYSFPMHFNSHTVFRLPVHLPGQQSVYFQDDDELTVAQIERFAETALTAWFRANQTYAQGRHLTYVEFPEFFVFDKESRTWKPRQRLCKIIGRLYSATPRQGERYYLRVLLLRKTGCTSYEDVRTLDDGTVCATFQDACIAMGLLESDREWFRAMNEAERVLTPKQLRALFVIILLFSNPSNPLELWNAFKDALSGDYFHYRMKQLPHSNPADSRELAINVALRDIERRLKFQSMTLSQFQLPEIHREMFPQDYQESRLPFVIRCELDFDREEQTAIFDQNTATLNDEQNAVVHSVVSAYVNNEPLFAFVNGAGGSGKTFVWKTILAFFRSRGEIAIATAASGIAALLLPNARTFHSRFKAPLNCNLPRVALNIDADSDDAELLRRAAVILIDEVVMLNKVLIEALNDTLQDITDCKQIFGGKIVICGGDFRQLLPVIRKGTVADVKKACLCRSPLWAQAQVFNLVRNERCRGDDEAENYANWLLQLGNGTLPVWHNTFDVVRLPDDICIEGEDLEALIDFVYEDIKNVALEEQELLEYFSDRVIVSPLNRSVNKLNEFVQGLRRGEKREFLSADTAQSDEDVIYPIEFLNSIELPGLPPHKLILQIGDAVILLRNLDFSAGLVNGTRLIITEMCPSLLKCVIITGENRGETVSMPRVKLSPTDTDFTFTFTRLQFPITLAYAMTINKSQGQTLRRIGVHLPEPAFAHGQLYVAASRVTHPSGIKILVVDGQVSDREGVWTRNVVHRDILEGVIAIE